jgi:Predicted flavin-nucleotide-binding protein
MRRKDRQVTELNQIIEIIERCDVCRIALSEDNRPYIVPMNFGYELIDDSIVIYMHCANEGKKLDILKKNNLVCFEMDCKHELITGATACNCSMNYQSVIGNSEAEIVTNSEEKIHALNQIMKKYTHKNDYTFEEKHLNAVTVVKLVSSDFTAKRKG